MSREMFCVFAISRCLTPCDCHLGIFHPSIALAAGDLSMRLRIRAKTLTILYFISSIELVEGDQKYPLTKRLCWKTYFLHVFVLFFHCLFALLSCPNFFVTTLISLRWETLRSSARWPSWYFTGHLSNKYLQRVASFACPTNTRFHTPIVFWFSRAKSFHRKTINIPIWRDMPSSSFPSSLLPKGLRARWARRANKSQSTINLPILKDSIEDMSCRTANELLRRSRVVDFSLPTYHHDVIDDGVPSFFSFPNRSPDTPLCSEAGENFDLDRPQGECQHLGRPGDIFVIFVFKQEHLRHL